MEKFTLYVNATGTSLPPAVSVWDAIDAGRYPIERAEESRQLAATVAPLDCPAPALAVDAARIALERAGTAPDTVGFLSYSSVLDTGFDMWNAASYVQREIQIPPGPAVVAEINSGCTGVIVSLQLAYAQLLCAPDAEAALLVASDCFRAPEFDRWNSDTGSIYGDCGSAIVVSRRPGPLRLVELAIHTDPVIEPLIRGHEPFRTSLHLGSQPINLSQRSWDSVPDFDLEELRERLVGGPRSVIQRVTKAAGICLDDVAHVILPSLGHHILEPIYFHGLGIDPERTTFDYGRGTGHTGASDPILGIDYLLASGHLCPGDWVLAVVSGFAFLWGAALFQVC
ncbi:ketoacyl-ACP synthase III family protein [Streptomyces murinus]|uniref:ketoacyl-ACP synthase III family protein n=1 Tax=Streptomyces murinus TaxID=33900 RepID=UPI00363105C6